MPMRILMNFYKPNFWARSSGFRLHMLSNIASAEADPALLDCSEAAARDIEYISVSPNFVSKIEEEQLMVDIHRTLRGKKYMYDHWDGAIRGYRETEKSSWNESNSPVITRLKAISVTAVPGKVAVPLEQVHVLDLAEDGVIEPHVDSVKGRVVEVINGGYYICLLLEVFTIEDVIVTRI